MSTILDSGKRREFESGALRDIQEGKGRCDLLPLDIVANITLDGPRDGVLYAINNFIHEGTVIDLYIAIQTFCSRYKWGIPTAMLEVAKHYEEGAKKYAERNWEKGIPLHCYIDSGVRHYLKYLRGDKDEPHDRAFIWNMLGALWTFEHKPELNDLPFNVVKDNKELKECKSIETD